MRRLGFLLLLLVAYGLGACSGGDDEESVQDLLDRAFSGEIRSADLKLEAEIDLRGLIKDPIRIEAEGPFRTNEGKLPSADIELRVGSGAGGQTITSGVLTTGDRAFLKFQDVYYEQPRAQVRETNRMLRRGSGRGRALGELGLDPRSWLVEARDDGDADVAGVKTRHVSGTLAVDSLMRNLNRFVSRSARALGAGRDAPPRLTDEDIAELDEAVKDPTFEVYVGKDDSLVRRVSGRIEFEVPERDRAGLGGLSGGSIVFSVELRDVNGGQEIEAPARARPLSKLTDSLGGGALEGLGAGAGTPEQAPEDDEGGRSTDEFRSYSECLDRARPEDTEELQRCADLLQQP